MATPKNAIELRLDELNRLSGWAVDEPSLSAEDRKTLALYIITRVKELTHG